MIPCGHPVIPKGGAGPCDPRTLPLCGLPAVARCTTCGTKVCKAHVAAHGGLVSYVVGDETDGEVGL